MKIENVQKVIETNYYVDVTDSDWSTYRRSESGEWEVLMGDSWESVYVPQYMESHFQEYVKNHPQEPSNTEDISGQGQETPESQ